MFKKIKEIYAMQKLQLAIADCPWLKFRSFSPGGMAMDALALHNLFRILNDVRPKNILEFGLGQSSKLVYQYAGCREAKALTIEHDQGWIDYSLAHIGNNYPVNVRQFDLETIKINNKKTLTYKGIKEFAGGEPRAEGYDLIIVDAPIGSRMHFSRTQILEFVPESLAKVFCIFVHDTNRRGEKRTLNLLYKKLERNGIPFLRREYKGVRNHTVVCSPDWNFLTSM
jgi:hypothetical protein